MSGDGRQLVIRDLGVCEYPRALELQEEAVSQRRAGEIEDTLFLVEHPATYTLGRNADRANITATPAELDRMGIVVHPTGRGGQVTYHGPGQLVGYPILDLRARKQGPVWYVSQLEEVLIRVLARLGITGVRDDINRGVWVNREKVAAIGVRITRHVTMHGFSLNVCVTLDDYRGIIPCGIQDRGVTSLDRLADSVTMPQVKEWLQEEFCSVFDYGSWTHI